MNRLRGLLFVVWSRETLDLLVLPLANPSLKGIVRKKNIGSGRNLKIYVEKSTENPALFNFSDNALIVYLR